MQWHFPDTVKLPLQTAFVSSPTYTEKLNFKDSFKSIAKPQLEHFQESPTKSIANLTIQDIITLLPIIRNILFKD